MIRLIRLDGTEILLNEDIIQDITDDKGTVITLISGEKLRVKNCEYDIIKKIKASRLGRLDSQLPTDHESG